jgi:hypothetical protein
MEPFETPTKPSLLTCEEPLSTSVPGCISRIPSISELTRVTAAEEAVEDFSVSLDLSLIDGIPLFADIDNLTLETEGTIGFSSEKLSDLVE